MAEMKKKGNGMLVGGIALAVAVAGGFRHFIPDRSLIWNNKSYGQFSYLTPPCRVVSLLS